MRAKCWAKHCTSNQKTEIDGTKLEFYSFPVDKNLKNQWKRICVAENGRQKRLLCELHFDISAFDAARQLKPDAVPTIESLKEKANKEIITISDSEPARKKSKTLESDEKHFRIIDEHTSKANAFRLTIQIDKIISRSSPLSKNICQTKLEPSNATCTPDSQEQTCSFKNGKDKQNSLQCLVCKEPFSDITDLYSHIKIHLTCDICNTEFRSRKTYEKHYELHKDELNKHNHITSDNCNEDSEENRIDYCESCNMTFNDEVLFRNHLNSHVDKTSAS